MRRGRTRGIRQWKSTLETYAGPVIGGLPVQGVDLSLVLKVLEPIWATRTETASRLRGRIEAVLDWGGNLWLPDSREPREVEGPSRQPTARSGQSAEIKHHAALPYSEMGTFMLALREQSGMGARALELPS